MSEKRGSVAYVILKFLWETKRLYTVRRFDGTSIDTIGEFQRYKTKEAAREAARAYKAV